MILRAILFVCAFAYVNALYLDEECLTYTIYPVQYEITITPFVHAKERSYYDCSVTITVIANAQNVNIIELDAKYFEFASIKVIDGNRDIINKHRPYEYNTTTGKLYIYLTEPLRQFRVDKSQYNINIVFRRELNYDSSTGIFLVPYEDGGSKHLIVTRLSPYNAKYFIPCFNVPRFESVFKFKVYVLSTTLGVSYSNASLVIAKEERRHVAKENNIFLEYIPSPQVALHQVGFHYSQFGHRKVTAKTTNDTIVIWGPSNKLKYFDFMLKFSERILNLIHEYAGVNIPLVYGPINIVSVPSHINGYESGSWNLLTNGETRLAYIPSYTSIKQQEKMTFELAQQLCRIWLGNPGELQKTRWKEEWFKEGVATYLAYYFLAQYENNVHSTRQRHTIGYYGLQMKHKAMSEDWPHSTPALTTFNRSLTIEIPSRYKELVTKKTASLLWMIENWLGSNKFHNALVKYINMRRGQQKSIFISLDDFLLNLDLDTVECQHQFFNGSTASKILKSWFEHPGYPVINVNVLRDRPLNAIQLKQHKFSLTHDYRGDSNYLIPISYLLQNNEHCFNCYRPRFTFDQTYIFKENLDGGWIILNRNASGYYRVNYDEVTWRLIAKTLRDNKELIDQQNRAQIVNDVFALYASGEMDHSLAVEILDYLDEETSLSVWEAAVSGFELLKTEKAACNMTKYLYKDWQEFMSRKVAKIYTKVAGEIEQQRNTRVFRNEIITFACAIYHKPCLQHLRNGHQNHLQQRHDPDSREAYYYMILHSHGIGLGQQNLNLYELEDKSVANHKLDRENKFLFRIPVGARVIENLMMSTTNTPTLEVTERNLESAAVTKQPGDGSSLTCISSVITLTIAILIATVVG